MFPTLLFQEILSRPPKAVVDMGAVRHVYNGADIMAPGIVRFEGKFAKGAIVLVIDVRHCKLLNIINHHGHGIEFYEEKMTPAGSRSQEYSLNVWLHFVQRMN